MFGWSGGTGFVPHVPDFDSTNSGVNYEFPITDDNKDVEYFKLIFDKSGMEQIEKQIIILSTYWDTHIYHPSGRWRDGMIQMWM